MLGMTIWVICGLGGAGNVWAGLADHWHIHRQLFIMSYVLSSLLRFSLGLTDKFPVAFMICVLTELISPPVMILMDAATMTVASKVGASVAYTGDAAPARRCMKCCSPDTEGLLALL